MLISGGAIGALLFAMAARADDGAQLENLSDIMARASSSIRALNDAADAHKLSEASQARQDLLKDKRAFEFEIEYESASVRNVEALKAKIKKKETALAKYSSSEGARPDCIAEMKAELEALRGQLQQFDPILKLAHAADVANSCAKIKAAYGKLEEVADALQRYDSKFISKRKDRKARSKKIDDELKGRRKRMESLKSCGFD